VHPSQHSDPQQSHDADVTPAPAPRAAADIACAVGFSAVLGGLRDAREHLRHDRELRPGPLLARRPHQPRHGGLHLAWCGGEILRHRRNPGEDAGRHARYYKDEEKTREASLQTALCAPATSASWIAEGRLRITGRGKEQFKTSKGKYVAPAPIENRLGTHPKVEACCVTGVSFPQPFALLMLTQAEWERCREAQAREELTRSLQAHLDSVNAQLDPHEQMDFVAVIPEQWTVDNGSSRPPSR